MRLTSVCVLLTAAGFPVAQAVPTLAQDFSGLFQYLTSSANEASEKVEGTQSSLVFRGKKFVGCLPFIRAYMESGPLLTFLMLETGRWKEQPSECPIGLLSSLYQCRARGCGSYP